MEKNLKITQGDEATFNLTFTSGGEPLDLSGVAVTMSAKKNLADEEYTFQKVVDNHEEPTSGEVTITLESSDTDIDLGEYYYDIQLSGAVATKTVLKGTLTITWQVTEE